jgi:hypothetical protein
LICYRAIAAAFRARRRLPDFSGRLAVIFYMLCFAASRRLCKKNDAQGNLSPIGPIDQATRDLVVPLVERAGL